MAGMPNPSERPSNAKKDIIIQFRDEYGQALTLAKTGAEHTATEGWRGLYADHRAKVKETKVGIAKRLRVLADTIEAVGWNEDDEKAVKEQAKASDELRATVAAFEREAVERVTAPVRACGSIIEKYKLMAEREERDAPLHNVGLAESMRMEISKHSKPSWDGEAGVISILTVNE